MRKQKKKKLKTRRNENFDSFIKRTLEEIREQGNFKDYRLRFFISKKDKHSNDTGHQLAASIEVDHRYLQAFITLYPPMKRMYRDKEYSDMRLVLCHELAHIKTHKIYKHAIDRYAKEVDMRDDWESLTEYIGRLLYENICFKKNQK